MFNTLTNFVQNAQIQNEILFGFWLKSLKKHCIINLIVTDSKAVLL